VSHPNLELQLDWDVSRLHEHWPTTPDNVFIMYRLSGLASEVTAAGATGRVLEVAAAEAVHACKLNLRGLEAFVLEPSPVMLARARARMSEYGARVTLVRGVAEALPFADHTFDRVLIDGAIDHLGQPELSLREMTRVLKPEGRLIITFVNYQSVSTRLSRLLYGAARRLRLVAPGTRFFWDTPVPHEHTFECTYDVLMRLCRPGLELDHVFGVSMGWMLPGWGPLLSRLPRQRALTLMQRLDHFACRRPRLADFIVSVWRRGAPDAARGLTATAGGPADDLVVRETDAVYAGRARAESEYWAQGNFDGRFFALVSAENRAINTAYTGDADRTWLDDLMARGPFERAAVLGCDEGGYERRWIGGGGSQRLDVYELSPGVIRQVRAGLGLGWSALHGPKRRVRFIHADLNFASLPADHYDVVWSSGCLHHIVNLERLFAEVERSLRPGGLFAIRDYVGEPRMQFDAERLARINSVLRQVPARYRRIEIVAAPRLQQSEVTPPHPSPFCGVRSDEILPLAEARFDVVHKAVTGALFPLHFAVDLPALERDAPEVLAQLQAAEDEALHDQRFRPCGAYVVLRKRGRRVALNPRLTSQTRSHGSRLP
jgi:SAM-dependent methyltransferase